MEPLPSDRITSVHCTICNRSWLHPCPEHSQPATHSHSIYYPPAYPAHVAVLFCKLTYITVAIDIGHNLIHFCEFSWGICESKIPSKGNEQVRGEVPGSTLLACLHKWSSLFLRTVRSSYLQLQQTLRRPCEWECVVPWLLLQIWQELYSANPEREQKWAESRQDREDTRKTPSAFAAWNPAADARDNWPIVPPERVQFCLRLEWHTALLVPHAEHLRRDHVKPWQVILHLLQGVWHPVEDEGLVLHGRVEVRSEGWVTKWVCVRGQKSTNN